MRTHMADRSGLTRSSGCGCGCGIHDIARRLATEETKANPLGRRELASGESPGPGDALARPVVARSFLLEYLQHPLRAVGAPGRHKTAVGVTERLG